MSNRPKIRKLAQKLTQDEQLRQQLQNLMNMLNQKLATWSPGAHFEANREKEGEFFIWTPGRRMTVQSISMLGMMLDFDSGMGEQALIRMIERVNKIEPLASQIQDEISEEKKMNFLEFVETLDSGLIIELRLFMNKLMDLPDHEGAVIGVVTSQVLLAQLSPLKAKLISSGEMAPMTVRVKNTHLPVASPTILAFVLKYCKVTNDEELSQALVIAGMLTQHPLFPEFQSGSSLFSQN